MYDLKKTVETKSLKALRTNFYFREVAGEKLVGRSFWTPYSTLILNRVNRGLKMKINSHWWKNSEQRRKNKDKSKNKAKMCFLPYSKTHIDFINNDFSATMMFFVRSFRIILWAEIKRTSSTNCIFKIMLLFQIVFSIVRHERYASFKK